MAFLKNTKVYLYIVVAAFALAACAKRDSSFAARKNAAGATYVNGQQAANADANAAALGYQTDIQSVQNPVSAPNGGISVTSVISVNAKSYQVVTTHYQVNAVSSTTATFDGATFQVSGVCANNSCSPYYLIINITRNGQNIKQTAMKKYFYYDPSITTQDLVLSLGPTEFVSVQGAIQTLDQAVVTQ